MEAKILVEQPDTEPVEQLEAYVESSSDCELPVTELEKLFKTRAKNAHDQAIVVTLDSKPVYGWDAWVALKHLVDLGLVMQLRSRAV